MKAEVGINAMAAAELSAEPALSQGLGQALIVTVSLASGCPRTKA